MLVRQWHLRNLHVQAAEATHVRRGLLRHVRPDDLAAAAAPARGAILAEAAALGAVGGGFGAAPLSHHSHSLSPLARAPSLKLTLTLNPSSSPNLGLSPDLALPLTALT